MTTHSFFRSSPRNPAATAGACRRLLESILSDSIRARREQDGPDIDVRLDLEDRDDVPLPGDSASIRQTIEPLVRRALESAAAGDAGADRPNAAEVLVTGVDLGDAFEIEVADSGRSLPDRLRHWLGGGASPEGTDALAQEAGFALVAARAAAARMGCTLHARNCPDGGVAVTLRLPRRPALRRAA